jgi:hypothetical protein
MDNKINIKEMGCEGVDCVQFAQDGVQWRVLVNMAMKLQGL